MQNASAHAVDSVGAQNVKTVLCRIRHQPIQRWTACFGPGEPSIHIFFVDNPSPPLDKLSKLTQLKLTILIGSGHSSVDGSFHILVSYRIVVRFVKAL